MIADFHIVTITHNDLNVDELGQFVLPHETKGEVYEKLHVLKEQFNLDELVYLNTCNRITFLNYSDEEWTSEKVKLFFRSINPALSAHQIEAIDKVVNVFSGQDAINHIFEVTSSINSLVVGEREIFRQFREAYNGCVQNGLVGDNLRLLEKYTVQTAKQVYEETKIGEKALSVVSLAMQKLLKKNLPLDSRILIVGAGETNTKLAKFLDKHGYRSAAVFNRSLENANQISEILDAPAYHLKDLSTYEKGFDILVVCTASYAATINKKIYRHLLRGEQDEKLIIDLSVPRNVEREVVSAYDVNYVDVEQLRELAQKNLELRKGEIIHARKILRDKRSQFTTIYQQRQIEKAMKSVPSAVAEVKEKALQAVFKDRINTLDEEAQALLNDVVNYMEKKCVSIPMKAAKEIVVKKK